MKSTGIILSIGVAIVLSQSGYALQPPPQPLNSPQFQVLIGEADIIVVGKVGRVKKIELAANTGKEITVEVTLKIEKLLKGEISGENIHIQESYPLFGSSGNDALSSKKATSAGQMVSVSAGPRPYHGKYNDGERIIILLKVNKGTDTYRPAGSGTYDQYLCEFIIDVDGIKPLYFMFADDMEKYTRSEGAFIGLIEELSEKN